MYDNPGCVSLEEFDSDYSKVRYIKVLLNKHINNKQVNVRLIINHLICMRNVFPGDATARILFTELDPSTWGILATFLTFLNMMPDSPFKLNGVVYSVDGFNVDENLLETLKEV